MGITIYPHVMGMLLACVSAYKNHKQTDLSSHGYQVTFDYFSVVALIAMVIMPLSQI